MASDLSPEQIRRASFRTTLRGYDSGEVEAFLSRLSNLVESLESERSRLESRLGEHADRDLETEFEQLGREVTAVLQSAREAAEAMRERASLDAARWRSESMAEAERVRKDARNDAEALRGDAWTTGSELLNQAAAEAKRVTDESQTEVLSVMGAAEREAHRLVSSARRETEDMLRSAQMDAEKVTSEATRRRDEMIAQAQRQASSAEERTRALEERRAELLEELENVRATLNRLEGTLEQRREDLNLSSTEGSSVKVVPPGPVAAIEDWEPGETIRIIPPGPDGSDPPPETEVEPSPPSAGASTTEDEPAPSIEQPDQPLPPVEVVDYPEASAPPPTETDAAGSDDVTALFASLRGDGSAPEPPSPSDEPAPVALTANPVEDALASMSEEFLEERDARLLPIINRSLRGVKKAVTDAQNVALDGLRVDPDWIPDEARLADELKADLIGLWTESFTAGHEAAADMLGRRSKRPETPRTNAAEEFGESLAQAVTEALIAAGEGQRERQSAASRVFRGWRTQEAERRIRELAFLGYRSGMEQSAGIGD